jgi:hypothetical protein
MITIRPHLFRQFVNTSGGNFYVLTNPSLEHDLIVEQNGDYLSYQVLTFTEDFLAVMQTTEEPAHILVISPDYFITSVDPACLGSRSLAVMAANSTPTSKEQVQHFLMVMEKTDPIAQRNFADQFFIKIEAASALQIIDKFHNTIAIFVHLSDDYEWFDQSGPLGLGQQQIVPSGEISVLPLAHGQYEASKHLAINGEIALQGFPVVHAGKAVTCRDEQERIYQALATLKDNAVIANVEHGRITHLQATHPDAEPARLMLEALFEKDASYRTIWELGFGINTQLELWPENAAMNEVYGGSKGVLHWGLGLTPYTQYHIDILCPHTLVATGGNHIEKPLIGCKN